MHIRTIRKLAGLAALYLLLACLLFFTNPDKLPIVMLIIPFIVLFAALFWTVSLLVRRFFPGAPRPRRLFFAAALAGTPTLLLVLSSINQLTWRDALLIILLMLFLLLYSSRLSFLHGGSSYNKP